MVSRITGNKFDPNTDIPDLSGKTYVVTGGSAGIGFGIVAHLLQHNPAKIYLLSNKEEHADDAIEELKKYGKPQKVEWMKCNLANLKQTDEVAKQLKGQLKQIDGLVCNAGIGVGKYWETVDGIDSHFQINHLSQIHLALTLLPVLQNTPSSRLAFQSSDLHRAAPPSTKFASIDEINQDIGPALLYNRTKLAQVLTVRAMTRRMEAKKLGFSNMTQVYTNATHPGAVNTDQQEQAEEAYGTLGKVGVGVTRPLMKDPTDSGCRSILFAATSEDVVKDKIQGSYIFPDRKVTDPSSQAQNVELGEQLWKFSFELLTEKLGKLDYDAAV